MAARVTPIDPQALEVRITTMRRRHLRSVLRIENTVYPRPWSLGLFMSELAMRSGRVYLVARVGATVVGYAGLLFSLDDGHVTTIAVDPTWQRSKIGTTAPFLPPPKRRSARGSPGSTDSRSRPGC